MTKLCVCNAQMYKCTPTVCVLYVHVYAPVCIHVCHVCSEGEVEYIPWPGIQGSWIVSLWNPKQTLSSSQPAWLKLTNHPQAPGRPRAA